MTRRFSTGPTTLQDAAQAVGNGTPFACTGLARLGVQVTIAGTATVGFEGSINGDEWRAVPMTKVTDSTTGHTVATASSLYAGDVTGLSLFRARIVTWTSDAVTVTALGTVAGT